MTRWMDAFFYTAFGNCWDQEMFRILIITGVFISFGELALMMREVFGFQYKIRFRHEMPDGTPRKLLNTTRLNTLRWSSTIPLQQGLACTYQWYVANERTLRK